MSVKLGTVQHELRDFANRQFYSIFRQPISDTVLPLNSTRLENEKTTTTTITPMVAYEIRAVVAYKKVFETVFD